MTINEPEEEQIDGISKSDQSVDEKEKKLLDKINTNKERRRGTSQKPELGKLTNLL